MKINPFKSDNPRHRQWGICAAVVLCAALASLSIFATGPAAKPATPVEKAWPVSVTTAAKQRLQPSFTAFGKIESSQVASLRSELVAQVRAVMVKEGDWIEAGETLVQLDDREAELQVKERRAALKQHQANLAATRVELHLEEQNASHFSARHEVAQAKLKRHKDLMSKRLISKSLLDEVASQASEASIEYHTHVRELRRLPSEVEVHEARVDRAEAQLQQALINLEKTRISAPFSGPVLGVYVAAGDLSNLTAPLVKVADADGFELRIPVPDQYVQQFDQALTLRRQSPIQAFAAGGVKLHLTRLAGHVRAGQTGVDAFFAFSRPAGHSAAFTTALGKVLNVSITLPAQDNLIALPVQSIYENQRVYAVYNNRLVAHAIERVGEHQSAEGSYQVLVRSPDLKPGAAVITTQLPRAISGLLVEVANAGHTSGG